MLQIHDSEVVISFPEVDEEAVLRLSFRRADQPEQRLNIAEVPGEPAHIAGEGRFVLYFRPGYPFAVLVSVGGANAITGVPDEGLERSPQNYFLSPPQDGIDGYFRGGTVRPFRTYAELTAGRALLDCRFHPLKRAEMDYFRMQRRLIPGPGPSAFRGMTIRHGGERQCEPIYEDICGFGTWDREHMERVSFWIDGGN